MLRSSAKSSQPRMCFTEVESRLHPQPKELWAWARTETCSLLKLRTLHVPSWMLYIASFSQRQKRPVELRLSSQEIPLQFSYDSPQNRIMRTMCKLPGVAACSRPVCQSLLSAEMASLPFGGDDASWNPSGTGSARKGYFTLSYY